MAAQEKATRLNPRDVQLQYRLGMMTDRLGDGDSARKILSGLVGRYPANALYRFSLARLTYRNGNVREAAFHLSKAIELSPGIMNTNYWNIIYRADTAYYHDIVYYLQENADGKTVNPVISAKYGRIMLNLYDTMQAERYLTMRSINCLIYHRPGTRSVRSLWVGRILQKRNCIYEGQSYWLRTISGLRPFWGAWKDGNCQQGSRTIPPTTVSLRNHTGSSAFAGTPVSRCTSIF